MFGDQYLKTVIDLIERMFSIKYSDRPTMAECSAIISQNVPTDEWPLLDDGEISICGLGTNPLLRNMYFSSLPPFIDQDQLTSSRLTQFRRKQEHDNDRRCKIYMLLNENKKRLRLAFEFEKELDDKTKASCVISDSGGRNPQFV